MTQRPGHAADERRRKPGFSDPAFPERDFPCPAALRPGFEQDVARGRERMAQSCAVICSLARDAAEELRGLETRLEALAASFREHRLIFVENDSRDDTVTKLRAWQRRDPRLELHSERLGAPRWPHKMSPERAEAMAGYRNRYLDRALEGAADADLLIVVDADLADFCLDGVAHTIGQDIGQQSWDAVGSYGVQFRSVDGGQLRPDLFDTWALRDLGHPASEPHAALMGRRYQRGSALVPVLSCFGGLAVYRMEAIRSGARYGGPDCEHATFHRRLADAGFGRIFLNPSQMTLYPPPARIKAVDALARAPIRAGAQAGPRPDPPPGSQP